ncbi:TPA: hypothetical protein ACX6NV_002019 [Photobacterium damselae]
MPKRRSRREIEQHNDDVFSLLISESLESVADTVETLGKKTIDLTPSTHNNAPTSLDYTANMWRWVRNENDKELHEFNSLSEKQQASDSTHRESHESLGKTRAIITTEDNTKIIAFNRSEYAIDLEIGGSNASSGMVMKTDAAFPSVAKSNFIKRMKRIK